MSDERSNSDATVEIFDPPMCCSTGMCGPVQDQALIDVMEVVRSLESRGVRVERYQPASHPEAFMKNPEVMAAVQKRSAEALPITVVNGRLVKSGAYPSMDEIQRAVTGGAR